MNCCDGGSNPAPVEAGVKNIFASIPPIMVSPYGTGLKCLESTLLPGTPIVIHDDGSIEYQPLDTIPPEINGYIRDEGNPFLFHPLWPQCDMRLHGTKLVREGIDVLMICNCDQAEQFKKFVTPAECQSCPLRKPHAL